MNYDVQNNIIIGVIITLIVIGYTINPSLTSTIIGILIFLMVVWVLIGLIYEMDLWGPMCTLVGLVFLVHLVNPDWTGITIAILILLIVLGISCVMTWKIARYIINIVYITPKERRETKKKTINIIQTGNLSQFNQFINKFNSYDKYIQKTIQDNLYNITDIEKINIICQECFKNRNPLLVKLIINKQWIASQPAFVKVYTILKTNQLKLIENSDGEEVKYLLDSCKDKDPEIANRAKQSLEEIIIINQYGIDYLCQEWLLKERDKFLESLIIKHQYQAVCPVRVKILTAFLHQQLSLVQNEGEEGVKTLLLFLRHDDSTIVNNSLKVLHNLNNQEGINCLCQQWANDRDKKLEEIIISQQYLATFPLDVKILTALKTLQLHSLSNLNLEETIILIKTLDDLDQVIVNNAKKMGDFLQDPTCKSLIYFITEQWEQYECIDFDQNLLKNVFYHADSSLRKKITEKIKISGRSDWLQVIFAERKRKNIELMTNYDWQVSVELLNKTDNDREKWKLAQQAPPFYGQQLLKQIHSLDFINDKKSFEADLFNLGKKVIPNPSDLSTWINNNSETVTISGHTSSITSLVMNREGTLLASGSRYAGIKLWELPSGRPLHTFNNYINSLVMNSECTLLASTKGTTIKIWELPSGRLLHTLADDLTHHTDWISSLVMNREGTLLASGSRYADINLWELPSGRLLHTLLDHTDMVTSLVMNREGTLLVSASGDKTIKLWQLPSGRLLHTLTGHTGGIDCLVMNREGTLLASANRDETIKLWQLPSGRILHTITGHTDKITSLVMNGEGTLLASASDDKTIKLWELPSGRLLHTLTGHTDRVTSLVMNREGTLLASASDDKTIKLWKLYSLDRLPLSKVVNYYDYIQDTLKRDDLNENQRNWFEFMLALVNNYRSFEIDIEDAPIIAEAGEFDIEIEG